MEPKQSRKQNWQTCPWCVKRGIVPPYKGARIKSFNSHSHKCEAAYLQETSATPECPSLAVVYQLLMSQQDQIACLQSEVARLHAQKLARAKVSVKALTARQCWDRRREHIHHIREFLGERKFQLYFDPENNQCGNILAAILIPALELRGEKLCLRGIDTTDLYCFAKQIWSKTARNVNLYWYQDELEKMGYTIDDDQFSEENDRLERAYSKFQATPGRAGGAYLPHGLVAFKRIWVSGNESMTECYEGFRDELYDEHGGTIFDPVPPPELLQNAAGQ